MKDGESSSSQKKAKKQKLTVAKKAKNKKQDYIDSDDDFVGESPGPSRCHPNPKENKQSKISNGRKTEKPKQDSKLSKMWLQKTKGGKLRL